MSKNVLLTQAVSLIYNNDFFKKANYPLVGRLLILKLFF